MKATKMFRIAGLIAMAFVLFFSSNLKATGEPQFVTNEERVGDLVVSKVIYRMDGSLYRHMKYDFAYDDQKRMTEKVAFKWDGVSEKWSPYFKMTYTYTANQIVLEYARWSDKSEAYDESVQKSVYELNEANMPVACVNYNVGKATANDLVMK